MMDKRYFRLINRAPSLGDEINWDALGDHYSPFETFRTIFQADNVKKESYFDRMTHFDFKTLLPALLQVEDRMSMAHGLESRVPFVDHRVVEFAATMPSNVKFKNGEMKHILKQSLGGVLPPRSSDGRTRWGSRCHCRNGSAWSLVSSSTTPYAQPSARQRDLIITMWWWTTSIARRSLAAPSGAYSAWSSGSRNFTTRKRGSRADGMRGCART